MFDEAHYRWKGDPDDGTYELQFDRFELNKAVLLIVDREIDDIVGQVVLPADDVPGIEPDDSGGGAILHGVVEDEEIIEMTYDPELTEQRRAELKDLQEQTRSSSDNNNESEN